MLSYYNFLIQGFTQMEFGIEHVAALINILALVWAAAKMHASVQGLERSVDQLKEFRKEITGVITEHTKQIAKIDIRVSLLERRQDGSEPVREPEFYDDLLDKIDGLGE